MVWMEMKMPLLDHAFCPRLGFAGSLTDIFLELSVY